MKYTISVDFDGVIHQYVTPWKNARTIPDPPVDGAIEWLFEMVQHFDVCIFSTRNTQFMGRFAMRNWLKKHAGGLWYESAAGTVGLEEITFPRHKPKAIIYIDDRAYRFVGPLSWPTKEQIHLSKPWNKS